MEFCYEICYYISGLLIGLLTVIIGLYSMYVWKKNKSRVLNVNNKIKVNTMIKENERENEYVYLNTTNFDVKTDDSKNNAILIEKSYQKIEEKKQDLTETRPKEESNFILEGNERIYEQKKDTCMTQQNLKQSYDKILEYLLILNKKLLSIQMKTHSDSVVEKEITDPPLNETIGKLEKKIRNISAEKRSLIQFNNNLQREQANLKSKLIKTAKENNQLKNRISNLERKSEKHTHKYAMLNSRFGTVERELSRNTSFILAADHSFQTLMHSTMNLNNSNRLVTMQDCSCGHKKNANRPANYVQDVSVTKPLIENTMSSSNNISSYRDKPALSLPLSLGISATSDFSSHPLPPPPPPLPSVPQAPPLPSISYASTEEYKKINVTVDMLKSVSLKKPSNELPKIKKPTCMIATA